MTGPTWDDHRLAFSSWAERYDRFRPRYPEAAVRYLVGTDPSARVLDVGAGTGRLAVAVATLGRDVLAVEPDDVMRSFAEAALPGRTARGSAEELPVPDASYDVVVAGQAFHWFEPDRALPEITRVLRPGGALGIIWNARDDSVAWVAELSELVGGEDRSSRFGSGPPDLAPWFGAAVERTFRHTQEVDVDLVVGLASSYSYVALRQDRDAVLAEVRAIATRERDRVGRDRFDLPYVTRAFRAEPASGRS